MYAFNNRRILIVLMHCTADNLPRIRTGLVYFGQQTSMGSIQMGQGFSQSAARQQITIAKYIQRINQNNIQIPHKLPMLVAIIQNDNLRLQLSNGIFAGNRSVPPDYDRHARQIFS